MQRLCQLLQSEGFQVFVHTEQPEPAAEALAQLLGLSPTAVLVANYNALCQKLSQRCCRAYFSGDADAVAALNARLTRPLACYISA